MQYSLYSVYIMFILQLITYILLCHFIYNTFIGRFIFIFGKIRPKINCTSCNLQIHSEVEGENSITNK